MKRRNYFTYTFHPRVVCIGFLFWIAKIIAVWMAYRMQWIALAWGLIIFYTLCSVVFIIVSVRKWLHYKHWH